MVVGKTHISGYIASCRHVYVESPVYQHVVEQVIHTVKMVWYRQVHFVLNDVLVMSFEAILLS